MDRLPASRCLPETVAMQYQVPLSRMRSFDVYAPREAQERVSAVSSLRRLTVRDQVTDFNATANWTTVANSSVSYLKYEVPIAARAAMERSYLFFAVLEGHMRLRMDHAELNLASGQGGIVLPERSFCLENMGRASAIAWKVSRAALERQAVLLTGTFLSDSVEFEPLVHLNAGKGPSLLRALRFVADELQDDSGVGHSRVVQENLELMLIRALLETQPSQVTEALKCRTSRVVPRCVLRVERYIAENLEGEITVAGMIEAAGVSERTMFSIFKKFRGRSPMAYVRHLRLQQVRGDLMNAEPGMRVTDILTKRGITQFGRFAVAYKKIYGESPSKTIKR